MKKFLAILLAALMLLTFVGCDDLGGDVDSEEPNNDPPKTEEVSRGTVDEDAYESKTLGIKFNKPESWYYFTDEEIAQMINIGVDNLLGDNFKEALKNNPSIYDMMATDPVSRTSVNVGYENLTKTFASNINEQQYLDTVKSQLSMLSSMKYTFEDGYTTVKLGDTEFLKLVAHVTANGVSMTQVYYVHKVDKYMGFVITTITGDYTVESVEAMFS